MGYTVRYVLAWVTALAVIMAIVSLTAAIL